MPTEQKQKLLYNQKFIQILSKNKIDTNYNNKTKQHKMSKIRTQKLVIIQN